MTARKKVRRKMGRPSAFRPEYVEQARKMCMVGATEAEMAHAFGVSVVTLRAWTRRHPEFLAALKAKAEADGNVVVSLYRRAMGYSHEAVKIFCDPKTGSQKVITYTERYPPDTVACIFWLKNRQRDQWRDRQEHDIKVDDMTVLSDAELTAIAAGRVPK